MKYGIIFLIYFFSVFLISCEGKKLCVNKVIPADHPEESKTIDVRCEKFKDEAHEKGVKTGVCYVGPGTVGNLPGDAKDPNPEACQAFTDEAQKKCDALPDDPDSKVQTSRSATYIGGRPVMIDGKPVPKDLPFCDECKNCKPIE